MYLPTTADGMNAAIGQYIHGRVAANIAVQEAEAAARAAEPGYVPEPYCWDKKTAPRKPFSMEAYCAEIRARKAGR